MAGWSPSGLQTRETPSGWLLWMAPMQLKHFGAPRQTPRPTLSRSSKMRRNILYTTEDCTQSKRLVCLLKGANLSFEEADMRSRESELQLNPWASLILILPCWLWMIIPWGSWAQTTSIQWQTRICWHWSGKRTVIENGVAEMSYVRFHMDST